MARGERCANTPASRSSALLRFITAADQRCASERRSADARALVWRVLRVLHAERPLPTLLSRVMLGATIWPVRIVLCLNAATLCRNDRSVR